MIPKFRAWIDGVEHIKTGMYEVANLMPMKGSICVGWKEDGERHNAWTNANHNKGVILMQSTGLFDSAGVEIFEGDWLDFGGSIGAVKNEVGHSFFVEWQHANGFTSRDILRFVHKKSKVIGNRYQLPHLLEKAS